MSRTPMATRQLRDILNEWWSIAQTNLLAVEGMIVAVARISVSVPVAVPCQCQCPICIGPTYLEGYQHLDTDDEY